MKGANFPKVQPGVTATFNADNITITKMYAQVNYSTYPSNVRQICVTLHDANFARLTYPNKTVIPELKSPEHDPTIEGVFDNVKQIRLRLCGTDDDKPPVRFRFAVVGCVTSYATYIVDQFTRPPVTMPRKR
jgi:hypothetical protein